MLRDEAEEILYKHSTFQFYIFHGHKYPVNLPIADRILNVEINISLSAYCLRRRLSVHLSALGRSPVKDHRDSLLDQFGVSAIKRRNCSIIFHHCGIRAHGREIGDSPTTERSLFNALQKLVGFRTLSIELHSQFGMAYEEGIMQKEEFEELYTDLSSSLGVGERSISPRGIEAIKDRGALKHTFVFHPREYLEQLEE